MGSEDLFHKRKAKQPKNLQRRGAHRKAYKRVLIVCEGETEVSYFTDARERFGLNSVDVKITNKGTTDPVNMVNFAKKCFSEANNKGNPFDLVFCVFDKDNTNSHNVAVQAIASSKPQNTFFAISSVPCFEYWLLLHFTCSTSPFANAKQVEIALKEYMPKYKKNQPGLFKELFKQLDQAKNSAKKALQTAHANNTDNPSTNVHLLITTFEELSAAI